MLRCVAVVVSFAASAAAQVALHPLFGDHAVLQRGRTILVRGTAQPGEAVSVSLGAARATGRAGADGVFVVPLPAQPASLEPARLVAEASSGRAESADVLVGDVWLCSGQSNMEFPLDACRDDADVAAANHPGIRHFGVEMRFATQPHAAVRGRWQPCQPDRARGFTAVGHHFAVRVHAATGVPIGLLRAAVGGTNIECWMAQDTLLGDAVLAPYAERMRASLARHQTELAAALPTIADWTRRSEAARAAGEPLPPPPEWPEHPFGERRHDPRCTTLHNGMVAPLRPFAVRGALWYQGENNVGSRADGDQYVAKMQALARDWQAWFGGEDFLFLYVQLAAWKAPTDDPGARDDWAELRDAQRRAHGLGPLRMASAVDVGDADDIHPRNKADVGARLAAWALREAYGQDVVPCGPMPRSATRDGGRIRICFDHVGGGLVVGGKQGRAPMIVEDAPLRRFAIAGVDEAWRWATARIDGDAVVVECPEVPEPRFVRYAWAANPAGANLYSREGFPASPFAVEATSGAR